MPWDIYFQTKQVREELDMSKKTSTTDNPIHVSPEDEKAVKKLETRLLVGAISAHLLSAGAVFGIARLTEGKFVRERTAWFFLGSLLVRPMIASHNYLKDYLQRLRVNVTHPRDDVNLVKSRISTLESSVNSLYSYNIPTYNNAIQDLRKLIETNKQESDEKSGEIRNSLRSEVTTLSDQLRQNEEKLRLIKQKFEETILQISKDEQMIQGVKLFLKTVMENK
jgi:hypothetical protein